MDSNSKRRKNIALFLALLDNEFSSSVLDGVAKAAKDADVNLFVFPMGLLDSPVKDKANFRYQYNILTSFLQVPTIDGAVIEYGTIVSTVDDARKKEMLSIIKDVPVVLLSEKANGYPSICINNKAGLKEIIVHLIEKHKCKKIAYVSGPKNNYDSIERLQVYKDTLEEYDLFLGEDWIAYGNFSNYSEKVVEGLLDLHPDADAIVFANDHMAIGAYPVFERRNIVVGKDILITGFDNVASSVLMEPPLATVMADTRNLGYQAVMKIVNEGKNITSEIHNTIMVLRDSCGCNHHTLKLGKSIKNALSDKFPIELPKETTEIDEVRNETRNKVKEAEIRRNYEIEINNINRQIVFSENTEMGWFTSILDTIKKMDFGSMYIFMYDDYLEHKYKGVWQFPSSINLVGYFINNGETVEDCVYEKGEVTCTFKEFFDDKVLHRDYRHNLVVVPLFFREHQYGLMVVESEIDYFEFAYQLAGNISSTLEIVNTLNTQEKIKAELALANQSKSQFLANMSHEIRTPINAILGMNEMILRESGDPQIDSYAMNIKSAANTLLGIINDILDFSKIEAGKMNLVEANYQLADLLKETMVLSEARLNGKDLELKLDYDSTLPSVYLGDDVRIKQVLLNIMSNGIKYTEKGSVKLCVTGHKDGDYCHISFTITDTGIGIKEDDLSKLFEEFQRVDESRNRNIEGTGLGMSITNALLNLMGSTLKVESEYGKGSTFSFTLLQKIIDDKPIGKNVTKDNKKTKEVFKQKFTANGARILVVDDIDINRVIIEGLLKQSGIEVCQAENGKRCLEVYDEADFDLILLDHMMPELDGIQTFELLKEKDKYKANSIPVIALTANAIEGSKEMYLENGFTDYISKPVDPIILDSMLIKYLPSHKIIFNPI